MRKTKPIYKELANVRKKEWNRLEYLILNILYEQTKSANASELISKWKVDYTYTHITRTLKRLVAVGIIEGVKLGKAVEYHLSPNVPRNEIASLLVDFEDAEDGVQK